MVDPRRVLTAPGWAVFQSLHLADVKRDFYLAGGTGLALHLGHRVSIDFDWFTDSSRLLPAAREGLLRALRAEDGELAVDQDQDGTLAVTWQGVRVSFFAYAYPSLEPPSTLHGLPVASKMDIAAMKLAAVLGRGSKKDFIDLHFLLRERSLASLLDAAARKFEHVADFRPLALRAMVYFDDADSEDMPQMLEPVEWEQVKEDTRQAAQQAGRRHYGLGDA